MNSYRIYSINGPIVTVRGATDLQIMEMVYVGVKKLVGEVIGVDSEKTTIQVYEDTAGLYPQEPVEATGLPMSITLGPGILGNIFDGIEKPLSAIAQQAGAFITKGVSVPPLDEEKQWDVTVTVKQGDVLSGGMIYAECEETKAVRHKLTVPPAQHGTVVFAAPNGSYRLNDCIVKIKDEHGNIYDLTLCQRWPIRTARPMKERLSPVVPLISGLRIIDTMFPIAKGGAAVIPGGFGTGKTVLQHQLAKWCDADIIIYVGCGERGNEMTQALTEFSELKDPRTGRPLLERTVLIANTSNMPVAAREASIYTGITFAEYYRDMGYHVAMMADSTSRWAEALREISGRLEEMPADEGYPAYLPSRLSEFYERAGRCVTLGGGEGSVTVIGAVSPQGSDFSEPVTQNSKRFTRCFWGLDKALAYARHFPAVNWNTSYSEYVDSLSVWFSEAIASDFTACRNRISALLAEEARLMEIVKLIGSQVLPDEQKLIIEIAKVIRTGFLQQDALSDMDGYVPPEKHYRMMKSILSVYDQSVHLIERQIPVSEIVKTGCFDRLTKMKYTIPNDALARFDELDAENEKALSAVG
ncbi:MAG: V-type ATP synthase subunit A [Clostridia bacterium]|nr:V-type ATP synthase subunit A [Clostridia bacterium]